MSPTRAECALGQHRECVRLFVGGRRRTTRILDQRMRQQQRIDKCLGIRAVGAGSRGVPVHQLQHGVLVGSAQASLSVCISEVLVMVTNVALMCFVLLFFFVAVRVDVSRRSCWWCLTPSSCGQIFCADCSEFWAALPDERLYQPVRLCGPCYHSVTTKSQVIWHRKWSMLVWIDNSLNTCMVL